MTQNNNLAYALRNFEPAEQQDKQPRIRQLEKSKAQARPQPKHLGRSLLCIGYIIVLCGALMFATVQLTEENNAMLSAQSTLEELESESARLELQVEGLSSLKTVEKTATEEYGLVEPDQSQVTCVRVKKDNKVEVADSGKSILDQASAWLEQIKEYILG